MTQTEKAKASPLEEFVSEADYIELSRLVLEHGWLTDNGRADKVHELYLDDGELVLPPGPIRGSQAIYEWAGSLLNHRHGARSATSPETCDSFATDQTRLKARLS